MDLVYGSSTVVGCKNLNDKEWFSRQDPYVCIEYGALRHRTRTDTGIFHTEFHPNCSKMELEFMLSLCRSSHMCVPLWRERERDDCISQGLN